MLILFRNGLDKATVLSYNTTPAEEGRGISLLFAADISDHIIIISFRELDHMWQLVCSYLLSMHFFSAGGVNCERFYHPKPMTT